MSVTAENTAVVEDEALPTESIADEGGQEAEAQPESASVAQENAPPQNWYEKLGDDFSGMTEDAALERVRNQMAQSREAQRLSQENQQYQAMLWQERQRQAMAQAQAQQSQTPAQPAKPKWQAPEFDPRWLDLVTQDEKGNLVPKPGAMPDLPQKVSAWVQHRNDVMNRVAKDPAGFFGETVQDMVAQQVQQIVQQNLGQYHQAQAVNQWETANADILYAPGSFGMQRQLTPIGQQIVSIAGGYLRDGMGDQVKALQEAMRAVHYDLMMRERAQQAAAPQQTAQQQASAQNAAAKTNLLRNGAAQTGARRAPSRAVASEANGRPPKRMSIVEASLAELAAKGIGANDPAR